MTEGNQGSPATSQTPASYLKSDDPLSAECCDFLVSYREETDLVDFKLEFDPSSNSKDWLELAKDCAAFANTGGGYLVYGIKNATWDAVGLSQTIADALADTKQLVEKISRGVAPKFNNIRSRAHQKNGLVFAVVCIPANLRSTHIFENSVSWVPPNGKAQEHIKQGSIFVRGPATNRILTSTDLDGLIERRISHFKDKVFADIGRVLKAEPDELVVTITQDFSKDTITVVDADLNDLRGKKLTFSAKTIQDKVAIHMTLAKEQGHQVPESFLLGAYAERENAELPVEQRRWLAGESLAALLPAFYWLRSLDKADAKRVIREVFSQPRCKFRAKQMILCTAYFFGKQLYEDLYEKTNQVSAVRRIPLQFEAFNIGPSHNEGADALEATKRAVQLAAGNNFHKLDQLRKLDCSLYAPFSPKSR